MNGKPDEHLDQWVRQSLDRLPDTPPPGTSFNSERLWTQLRPELQTSASPRWRAWVWWAAAACLIGAVLGWFTLNQPQPENSTAVAREKRPAAPLPIDQQSEPVVEPNRVVRAVPMTSRPSVARKSEQPVLVPAQSGDRTAPTVALATEAVVDTHADSTASTAVRKATVAIVNSPKRRFQVVHLNELQAEEEIRPNPHRSERFVRLGLGNTGTLSPDAIHPSISLPINTKSNQ